METVSILPRGFLRSLVGVANVSLLRRAETIYKVLRLPYCNASSDKFSNERIDSPVSGVSLNSSTVATSGCSSPTRSCTRSSNSGRPPAFDPVRCQRNANLIRPNQARALQGDFSHHHDPRPSAVPNAPLNSATSVWPCSLPTVIDRTWSCGFLLERILRHDEGRPMELVALLAGI